MRIVAGKFRGRNLVNSEHLNLRPTTDKNREALFNILSSGKFAKEIDFNLVEAKVLDMCCGTGAVGFEALSRGAKTVNFVDLNRSHLEIVKKNAALLDVENQCQISCLDAKNLPQNNDQFDLVFIDPPYAEDYQKIVSKMLENNWIQENSLVVIESQSKTALDKVIESISLVLLEQRKYGVSVFYFCKKSQAMNENNR